MGRWCLLVYKHYIILDKSKVMSPRSPRCFYPEKTKNVSCFKLSVWRKKQGRGGGEGRGFAGGSWGWGWVGSNNHTNWEHQYQPLLQTMYNTKYLGLGVSLQVFNLVMGSLHQEHHHKCKPLPGLAVYNYKPQDRVCHSK